MLQKTQTSANTNIQRKTPEPLIYKVSEALNERRQPDLNKLTPEKSRKKEGFTCRLVVAQTRRKHPSVPDALFFSLNQFSIFFPQIKKLDSCIFRLNFSLFNFINFLLYHKRSTFFFLIKNPVKVITPLDRITPPLYNLG